MSLIIPYEDKLDTCNGAVIKPNGSIIYTYGEHESFAKNYCRGKDYSLLTSSMIEGVDIYSSSKLTKQQLELYKLWLRSEKFPSNIDFMVYLLRFDKVGTLLGNAITTTNNKPHIRFYNYYLMDWYVDKLSPMRFNKKTGTFEYNVEESYIQFDDDEEAAEEIKKIKSTVLCKKDRRAFFK